MRPRRACSSLPPSEHLPKDHARTFAECRNGKATPETFFPKLVGEFGASRIAWGSNYPASEGPLKNFWRWHAPRLRACRSPTRTGLRQDRAIALSGLARQIGVASARRRRRRSECASFHRLVATCKVTRQHSKQFHTKGRAVSKRDDLPDLKRRDFFKGATLAGAAARHALRGCGADPVAGAPGVPPPNRAAETAPPPALELLTEGRSGSDFMVDCPQDA